MDEEILESFLTKDVTAKLLIVMIIILFKMYLSILEKKHSLLLMN